MLEDSMFSVSLLNRLKKSCRLVVLTGAGISAESGVPTFRGEGGIWQKYNPQELANFDAFMQNPERVWEWYALRRRIVLEVEPNPGHFAIAELEKRFPHFWLITQNVDGLHQKAGNRNIVELHGNMMNSRCVTCGKKKIGNHFSETSGISYCECGELMRPDVIWFGEMIPENVLRKSWQASEESDVFLTIGTSGLVEPAASLPMHALHFGAYVVEINIERTLFSRHAHEVVLGPAGTVLPALLNAMETGC